MDGIESGCPRANLVDSLRRSSTFYVFDALYQRLSRITGLYPTIPYVRFENNLSWLVITATLPNIGNCVDGTVVS